MHTETPLPFNSRAIREARKASTGLMLEPEQQTSQAHEETETHVNERGYLPAAAFENAPPDSDRYYKLPDSESEQEEEEEPLAREETGSALSHLKDNVASMSMDDLLNRPDELNVAAPVPVAVSRPTSPVARTLSAAAVDMEEDTVSVGDLAAVEASDEPVPGDEPSESIRERKVEIETKTTDTKTSLVDVEFRGLPFSEYTMDKNLRSAGFAEVDQEEEEDVEEGEEGQHCGLPVGHHHVGSSDTAPVVVERTATEEFRGRHDSLGIIHPPAAPAEDGLRARGEETDKAGRGTASSPESETSDYTPYTQAPLGFSVTSADHQTGHGIDTYTSPSDTEAPTDHDVNSNPPDTGLPISTQPASPPDTAPVNADSSNTDTETNRTSASNLGPTPEETSHTDLPNPDNIDTAVPTLLNIPSNADADAEVDSYISTASERGSYTDINEPTSPVSPTAAKAMEEDDDADFVPEQWQGGEDVQLQGMEREGLEKEHVMGQGQGQGQKEEVLMDEIEDVLDDDLLEPDERDVDHHSVERAQGCIDLAVAEIEREWEREHQGEHEQQQDEGEKEQEQGVEEEAAALQKEVIEKEVLQGLVDDPVGPAHDGRFELQEEATRARGVLEPYASEVDLGQGAAHEQEEAQKYEEAEGPVMGVEGVAEPCVTRVGLHPSGHGPEHEDESEPQPVPVEELVKEQEEMGLGRPEPHDLAECGQNEGHAPVQILDMDHHPLDPSHIPFAVGVALTHSESVQMHHTPIEEGDHEPAHYFVNQHHVPHSTDDYYTPAESPLHRYDHHQGHLDDSYAPNDYAEEHAHDETYHKREVPDVSEEVEEDIQPRYQLYERPYTPSDLAPTPGLEASFHSAEHAASMDGQPEVVVTLQPDTRDKTADDQREDWQGDDQDTEDDDDDDEISHQLERVPSRQDFTEEPESHGPGVGDFPATATSEYQYAEQSGDMHHRDTEPGPQHDVHEEDYNEDAHVQEALSSESESEDFEGRDDIVTHHLDAIAEEECDEAEAELGDGFERRGMAAEAEKQAEGHVDDDEVEAAAAALSDEHDVYVDESNVKLFSSDIVQSVAEAEAKTEGLVAPRDTVESAPVDVHGHDMEPNTHTFVHEQHEAEGGSDVEDSTEYAIYEGIDEEGIRTRSSEGQSAFDEAPELKAAYPVTEQEHAFHEHHEADEDQQPHESRDDDEYDPFRYSSPKTITEEHVTPAEQLNVEGSPDKVLSVEEPTSVLSHEQSARAEKSLAEELEDVGEEEVQESDYEGQHDNHIEYNDEGQNIQREEHHAEQSPAGPVAIGGQIGHGYRLSNQEEETLSNNGRSHDHDKADAQPSQPCEPPVLQLTEPSDTENGEFPSDSYYPHAVTRGEDMGRDWSEVDQFLSESDYEDEPERAEHVEETAAGADVVAHAHPSLDVDLDAEVEAALETPATEGKFADNTAELHEHHDDHVGMQHSPELAQGQETNPESAAYDDRHEHDDRLSTPLEQLSQSEKPGDDDRETVTPTHPHDLPPLFIPATPPGSAQSHISHETQQQPKEEEQELIHRDVTNRASRSDTVNTAATFATADTSGTAPTASSPQSARSGTTLSSGPSSPVEEPASGQDPRIRDVDSVGDNIGRPRGSSSLTDAGTDYSGGGYGDSLPHDKGHYIKNRASTPKIMEMWHQREASLSRNEEVRLSGESARSSSQNRVTSGSGSGSGNTGGGGERRGGSSLFQRMRSVFEQSSSPSSGSVPATSASNNINRVSMPSFFTKSHTSSPSQSASVFESTTVKQRPMSTSPYPAHSSSQHRDHDGYGPPAFTQPREQVEAEEAGEDRGLFHRDSAEDTSSDEYNEEYEREREREEGREEWREGQGMVHAYGEESSRYDYGEKRPE